MRLAIEAALPHPPREVKVTIPYQRGDLVSRAHAVGEIVSSEHGDEGTYLHALVPEDLAAEMAAAATAVRLHSLGAIPASE